MSTAVTAIETNDVAVRQLLQSLFHKHSVQVTADTPAAEAEGPLAAAAAAAESMSAVTPLKLHPRVDAAHPMGTAHTAEELEAALRVYSQLVSSLSLEVDDVLLGPDKALATGHLVAVSRLSELAAAGTPLVSATTHALPDSLRALLSDTLLPEGLKPARVPVTIHMRLGKNDAGDAVVTHMSLVFSLLSVLLPHVQLNAKQQQLAAQSQPALLSLLQQLGSATAVAEDALTSVGASWRAGTAVLQATVGQVLSAATQQAQSMWARRSAGAQGRD